MEWIKLPEVVYHLLFVFIAFPRGELLKWAMTFWERHKEHPTDANSRQQRRVI
jgi:hypothetical protein